jgi:hypothetical protein
MIIVKMMGAMGNQMFQYALGKLLAKYCNTKLYLDLSFVNDKTEKPHFVNNAYQLDVFSFTPNLDIPSGRQVYHITEDSNQNPIIDLEKVVKKIHFNSNIYLTGYFQKTLYTDPIFNELMSDFTIKQELSESEQEMLKKIENSESVCVNFRREFGSRPETIRNITNPGANQFHGVFGMNYFNIAIKKLKQISNKNFKLFVFADDISWVKENFASEYDFEIVDHSYKGDRFGTYLKLMQSCKHFIIPNSTFAWWAAYLSNTKGHVITPLNWLNDGSINTNDLRPIHWIKV